MAVTGKAWRLKSTGKYALSFDGTRPADDQFIYDTQEEAEAEAERRFRKSTEIERSTQGGTANPASGLNSTSIGLTR